jgi:hypothetical protein
VLDIDFFIAAVPSGITAALIVCDGSFMQRLVIGEKRIFPPPPDVLKHKQFAIPSQAPNRFRVEGRSVKPVNGGCHRQNADGMVLERERLRIRSCTAGRDRRH